MKITKRKIIVMSIISAIGLAYVFGFRALLKPTIREERIGREVAYEFLRDLKGARLEQFNSLQNVVCYSASGWGGARVLYRFSIDHSDILKMARILNVTDTGIVTLSGGEAYLNRHQIENEYGSIAGPDWFSPYEIAGCEGYYKIGPPILYLLLFNNNTGVGYLCLNYY